MSVYMFAARAYETGKYSSVNCKSNEFLFGEDKHFGMFDSLTSKDNKFSRRNPRDPFFSR